MRSMPLYDALRYLGKVGTRRDKPVKFSVLGYDVYLRPGTTDLTVACESLGAELEIAISYFERRPLKGVIVDAGGYIGTSAIKLANAFPAAQIFVLEPSQENFALLLRNVAGYPNVVPIQKALSDKSEMGYLINRNTGNWGFTIVDEPADVSDWTVHSKTQTISMEQFLRDNEITEIGLFKIDIEGAEVRLLECSDGWLDQTEVVVIELHDWIVPGVEDSFFQKTTSRANLKLPGEKYLSIRRS